MAVRSNYIKNLMETKNSLDKQYQEVIAESMKNIIGDNAKDEVRKLLKEADEEDSYSEEEVNDDTADTDKAQETDTNTEDVVDKKGEEADTTDGELPATDTADGGETEDGEGTDDVPKNGDDLWQDLENCKSADGEYDCRGMDDSSLLKVLKAMGPEDGIRVMRNDDGTVGVEVDGDLIDGTQEFIIDLDDLDNNDGVVEESKDNECNESDNTGYTDNYQKETAMTTPYNHEPANPKTTYSMDGGVPSGTEKPYANQGDKAPYDKKVNDCGNVDINEGDEEVEYEIENDDDAVNEVASTTENNPTVRGTGMTHANTNSKGKKFRSSSEGGQRVKGTGENSYSGFETNESKEFKRKMNKLYEENKQMKSIIPELNKKLMESMVINASMGYIVRLLNENTTSVDEKKEISKRFAKVTTLDEGKKLYDTISDELHKVGKTNNVNGIINSQLAESKQGKQSLVETTVYKSGKVNEALDFMKRLDKVK